MELRRLGSVAAFLGLAGEFLAAREAEHNLIFGICSTMLGDPTIYPEPPYLGVVIDGDRVVAAAMRTPPHALILSETDVPEAIDVVLEDLAGTSLPGVLGPAALSAAFAEHWAARAGGPVRLLVRERAFRLGRVKPPRPVAGSMRAATPADRPLVVTWLEAFVTEALEDEEWDSEELANRWIGGRTRTLKLWEDGGQVVSLAGVGGRTPTGIRIGPVYTPPEHRGVGYASNLVAAAAQEQLDAGRSFVFLFTDRANPTSNHIYEAIGFEAVSDIDRYAFG
ncbi:MAG TPA: GNAT family N-acetyltransferase [Candidatus Limnocylindrales bacterium]|nr:GNAT family N-acetyltransferase [Candidatus Limnocylindrales bacterium]